MYCSACGKQIADEVLFCPYCGTLPLQGDELTRLVPAARSGDQNAISALYEKTYNSPRLAETEASYAVCGAELRRRAGYACGGAASG